ncbi:MAG TPA: FliH/SctL family protein [Bryobacteraceae bacterium]|jgi:flagellar assembly protein FliH|nr:FliH/SctL family protein [Bryobacteraceae bacterium]
MLSKVLKGAEALQVQPMCFADASGAVAPVRRAARAEANAPDETFLMEKIRRLEGEAAAAEKAALERGRREGEEAARAAMAPVIERLKTSVAEVIALRPELRRRAEKDTVELALKIAKRVLHRELSVDVNALNALARVVFDRLARSEKWELTVHPRFADSIRGALPANARVETAPDCEFGTLRVRYEDGTIDASVDQQLAEIGRGIADRLR